MLWGATEDEMAVVFCQHPFSSHCHTVNAMRLSDAALAAVNKDRVHKLHQWVNSPDGGRAIAAFAVAKERCLSDDEALAAAKRHGGLSLAVA
jgi:hypothetical protein